MTTKRQTEQAVRAIRKTFPFFGPDDCRIIDKRGHGEGSNWWIEVSPATEIQYMIPANLLPAGTYLAAFSYDYLCLHEVG